jgi:hypothetical protein
MASHAGACGGKRHLITGVGIGVARPALQTARDMSFVAVGKRLRRTCMVGQIVRDFLFGGLLRASAEDEQKQRR